MVSPKRPAGQSVVWLAPALQKEPAGQDRHAVEPALEANLPAKHGTHVSAVEAPIKEENLPTVQFRQSDWEVLLL